MPFQKNEEYKPPLFLFNKHLETIYPALFRKVDLISPVRERLELEDGDFLDLDWFRNSNSRLLIINHGLEGSSDRPYMQGMARKFIKEKWDVLCWNFRGCSGEINRLPRFYHSGETSDLSILIDYASKAYAEIFLIGFSLGGNVILKYLGENPDLVNSKIKGATAFSVPVHLESSCKRIMSRENVLYQRRFLNNLKNKILIKQEKLPGTFNLDDIMSVKTIMEFDDKVTAPLHGFKNAHDYYEKSSSLQFLTNIRVPTLLVNSENDPMLSEDCYPVETAEKNEFFHFEQWKYGGHVGFYNTGEFYASEDRSMQFFKTLHS